MRIRDWSSVVCSSYLLSAAQPKFIAFSSSLERVRFALTFTTLRLNMPQWQGGDEPAYRFGSELLRWLAPPHDGPEGSVEVPEADGNHPQGEHGLKWRDALLSQAMHARQIGRASARERGWK